MTWLVPALAVSLGLGVYGWHRWREAAPQTTLTPLAPVATPPAAPPEVPTVRFTDITEAAGIKFVHFNGAYGEKLLPETMGAGVLVFDFDVDGDQDLLFLNGTYWPWDTRPRTGPLPTPALYANDVHGRFQDVTRGSGLDVSFYGMGGAAADYDNDGLPDLFLTAVGRNRLFHNEGAGQFREVTDIAGVGGETNAWSTGAAWIDYDNDGLLDLFVCNYVQWSRPIDLEVNYTLDGVGRAYGPPMNFQGTFPYLYHNEGRGRFRDVSAEAGVRVTNPATGQPMAKALAVAPVDVDQDGWIDLIVANDTVQNFLFHNLRNGRFEEIGARAGVAFDAYGKARGAMGIDTARFREDGALGIAIANFANEMNALFVSEGPSLLFSDDAIPEGVGPASRLFLKFGLFFFDYDLDGRLDLLTANGHLEEEIHKVQASQQHRQPAQLFWNRGPQAGTRFVPVPKEKCGGDLLQPIVGRGSAYGDLDGDGDLDVVMTQVAGRPLVLRNDQTLGHHWLRVKLQGVRSNRDAIGAWVELRAGGRTFAQQVMPTKSYLSQSELPVTFGLGTNSAVESLTIHWPGGHSQQVQLSAADRLVTIRETAGVAQR